VGPRSGLLLLLRIELRSLGLPARSQSLHRLSLYLRIAPVHGHGQVGCLRQCLHAGWELLSCPCFKRVGVTQTERVLRKASHQLRDPAGMIAMCGGRGGATTSGPRTEQPDRGSAVPDRLSYVTFQERKLELCGPGLLGRSMRWAAHVARIWEIRYYQKFWYRNSKDRGLLEDISARLWSWELWGMQWPVHSELMPSTVARCVFRPFPPWRSRHTPPHKCYFIATVGVLRIVTH
jgi:hypothetical protein